MVIDHRYKSIWSMNWQYVKDLIEEILKLRILSALVFIFFLFICPVPYRCWRFMDLYNFLMPDWKGL